MNARESVRSLLRARGGENGSRVTPVELFFDLVFVFAVTQVSHALLANFSPVGMLEAGMLFVAVWWVWVYTAWVTNWLDPDRRPVRLALLALMLGGLLLAVSLPQAFDRRGLVFAFAYVAMQVGRAAFMIWAVGGHAERVRDFQRILCWSAAAGFVWIVGGCSGGYARIGIWALALGIELLAPFLAYRVPLLGCADPSKWDVDPSHLAERCALFVLIGLGESLVLIGATVSAGDVDAATATAFIASFVAAAALWWIYFDRVAEGTREAFARSSNPGSLARLAYTYVHALLVAGIVLVAVGDERMLARPHAESDVSSIAVVIGGAVVFLASNAWFVWIMNRSVSRSLPVGAALLAVLACLAPVMDLTQLACADAFILVLTAAAGSLRGQRKGATPSASAGLA